MENDLIHRLIDEKKWPSILREIDQLISKAEDLETQEFLINIFESIDEEYREEHAQKYHIEMWKIAFKAGKIKLAKIYAEIAFDYLIEFKRIPQIKKILGEFKEYGLFKGHAKLNYADFILGKKINDIFSVLQDWSFLDTHPEAWKNSAPMLRQFLIGGNEWELREWKLAYEYILKFYYDRDLFIVLTEKCIELNRDRHKNMFLGYLQKKKVNLKRFEKIISSKEATLSSETSLHIDYDQIAMDVMSGVAEPSVTEQRKILISIDALTPEELLTKGRDMVVAFGLLGMDRVVVSLCEKLIGLLTETHQRAGLQFMMAQSLYNSGDFYKAIDVIDDIFSKEPLLGEERVAFMYLKAESYMKLKKFKNAKELFLEIKKQSSNYRLVGERLRYIETIK